MHIRDYSEKTIVPTIETSLHLVIALARTDINTSSSKKFNNEL